MNQKEKGFTLVEMIVTMAVLSILLSVSVFGLIAWQENARFTQQNEYAQTLFVAAQNQMTEYSRNGILERFQTKITDAGGSYERVLDVTGLTDGQGNIYTKDQVWYEGSDKGNNASRYQGELCYVSCKAGDYELYKSGNLGSAGRSRGADVLFELLSNYVYDQSILNNSISVEFSPDEGQIFAVCFSDEGSEFIYDEPSNTATSGLVNIANREESYRKGYMVGYYGTDTLARSTSATSKKPMLAKVKLNNEETLNLSFRVLKVSGAAQQLKYNLDVYDKDTKRMMLSLVVDGSQIHNYETRSTVQSAVTRYVYDADGKQTVQELGDYDILAWIEEDETIRIVLDAADIQATTIGYLSDLKNADAGLKGVNAASTDFASTYSFHRFGIDADNIYCTVQGSGGNYKTTAMKQSNSESVYFATANVSVSTDKETSLPVYDYSYTIGNGRHLYNVRFVEDLSASEQNEYSDAIDSSQITNRFEVSKDIDWNDFVASGNLYYTRAGMVSLTDTDNVTINQIKGAEGSLCARVLLQCDFPSIKQLRYGDTFTGNSEDGKDSENKEIAGLSICETSNVLCSVYTVYNDASLPLSEIFENNSEGESLAETEENSEENSAESYLEDERPVGLFVNNFGTISKLCLDRITVEGNRKVGAFCGENGGNLTKLEVKSSDEDNPSTVTGMENVGGIMGYQRSINDAELYDGTAQTPELCELTNRAKITGIKYVGGIVGEIYVPDNEEQPAITIENCKNYGAITARNSEKYEGSTETEAKTEPRYLGGIVGYCHNEYVDENNQVDMEHLKVVECISSPEYSEEDLDLLLERNTGDGDDSVGQITDKNYTGENLRGVYVGGIVGYNYFGTIENCSAEAESGKTGYIFGYQYVGGIVGFNQGPASGIKGGSDSSDKGVNENNVVGYQYVGGISGCNSDILYKEDSEDPDLDDYDVIQPNPETNLNVKISNWENRGVIFALDSYAGGITGYNAGWLYDCDSKVRNNETGGFFQETYSGDYAGGISGYNNGTIGKTDREILADGTSGDVISRYSGDATTICYVTGRNYVGGIVGYNDVDAVVEDYGLAGGKIKGSGSFVGGYAGFNASLNLLMDEDNEAHTIVSKPNEVSGQYFVGGNIGGNIVDCTGYDAENGVTVNSRFETNNFFGKITSEAFAGGFVGYNLLLTNKSKEQIYELQKNILESFADIDAGEGEYADYEPESYLGEYAAENVTSDVLHMIEKVEVLDNLNTEKTYVKMQIAGDENTKTQNRLGRIQGNIYLGGVIGYNDKNTELSIRYVTNTTPIIATMAIPNANEQKDRAAAGSTEVKEYDGVTGFTYSYAGGIIGKVTENVTLYQCENGAGANVTGAGTYTGGLAEVNEGIIEKCEVSSIGAATADYIGGICGLNKKKGTITGCILSDKSISGRNYVGGIVAENFGLVENSVIQNADNKSLVNTTVSAVGIDVAAGGNQILEGDGEAVTEKQGVVGCVAAYNAGTISQNTDLIDVKITSGGNYAGAIVGVNDGNVINGKTDGKIKITGSVSGQEYVGGVIGINKGVTTTGKSSNNQVSGYRNEASVTAELGNAGGILGNNASGSDIRNCENAGTVIARKEGRAGGITAENYANIIDCIDYGEVSSPNGDCGGIAAWNYSGASIEDCQVISPDEDTRLEFTAKDTVGGITSHNEGNIINPQLTNVYVYNYTNSPASNIGVVTGVNYKTGKITLGTGDNNDSQEIEAVVNCIAETYTDNSNVGGVAGLNMGTVTASEWYKSASLDEGGEDLEVRTFDKPKVWVSCTVGYKNDGVSFGDLGGIAGKNNGIIENIGVKSSEITGKLGSTTTGVGGVAGVSVPAGTNEESVTDKPEIKNCTFDGTVKASGTYANTIYLGGIVGLNQAGSTIYGCRIGVEEETTISNGGSADTTQYGYVGGIAGTTYGDIVACDSYHTDGTSAKVLIETNAGQVGGVTGVQQSGAKVTGEQNRRLSTGKGWTISYYRYINDHAIGGVVGSSYSNEYYEYISNYATALYVGEAPSGTHFNKASGGILGRLWPSSTRSVHFTYCYNYGDVLGKTTATGTTYTSQGRYGGIIGQLQYSGVTIENCKNYATLRGGHYAGGMIGCVYTALTDIEILNCENHGNLYAGTAAAGMIANRYHGNGGSSCDFIFYGCVNTGLVGSSNNAGTGIGTIKGGNDGSAVTGYYAQCQNYGYAASGSGFTGIQKSIAVNSILNCFDMSGGTFSASTASNSSGNYFVNSDSFTKTDTASSNSSSARLNYKNGALYIGSTITSVDNLTTLSDGKTGSTAYFNEKSTSYIIGGSDAEQNIRYRTYLEMSKPVAEYIESTYCVTNIDGKEKLDNPSNLKLNYRNNAGYETLTWNKVNQAYSYEIKYTVTKSDGSTVTKTEEIEGLCRLHIENDELEDASNLHVEIRAKDGCADESHYSDWTVIDLVPKEILATPQYHFEVIYQSLSGTSKCNDGKMVAVLDNAEDYIRNGEKIADVKITGVGTWVIDPLIGYTTTPQSMSKSQKQTRAYATPVSTYSSKYVQSPISANVTYIVGTNIFNTEYNTVSFAGFYGDTNGNLSYNMTIGTNKYDTNVFVGYYTQEVMAYDDELNVVISYAHGETKKDMTGDISLTLSGFPTDLTGKKEIIVKNIFWGSQGYSTYYGHKVAENVTLDQLKALEDENFLYLKSNGKVDRKTQSIWSESGELEDGYIIYKNTDGTYSVYYSALYAGQEKLERAKKTTVNTVGGLTQMTYTRSGSDEDDTAAYTDSTGKVFQIQPKPVIEALSQDEEGYYVFTWDEDKSDCDNAVYDIELTGTTIDGTSVSLATVENITWDKAEKKATYRIEPQDNWNYKMLTLSVSRHGEVDAKNKTVSFPSEAEREFTIKLSLTQIVVKSVNHDTDAQGNSNMDELLYHVIWDGVPTAAEQDDLGGYLITVTGNKGTATHYYYVLEDANQIPDTIENLKRVAEETGEKVIDVTDTYDSSVLQADVNFEDFANEETITVSIRAIAANDAEIYKDGPEGIGQSQTLPAKLNAPDVSKLSVNYSAEVTDGVLMVSDFDKGITVTYNDASGSASERLCLAAAVYDSLPDNLDENDISENGTIIDSDDRISGEWDAGALETLVSKEAKKSMSGNLQAASTALYLTGDEEWSDYAGKWLKLAIRSTSDSAISSNWTDEDEDGKTSNYIWVHLPKAQLDAVNLKESDNPVEWSFNNGYWTSENISDQYIITRTLSFETKNQAEGYRIPIVGTDASVHWIYICKDDDRYIVSYAETGSSLEDLQLNTTSPENAYTTMVGILGAGESLELPYVNAGFAMQEADMSVTETDLYAVISLDEDGESFTLSLPDVIGYSLDSGTNITDTKARYLITSQVSVQAVIYPKTDDDGNVIESGCMDSEIAVWNVDEAADTDIESFGTLPEAPVMDDGLNVEESEDEYLFKLSDDDDRKLAVQILVTDENDELKEIRYEVTDFSLSKDTFSYVQDEVTVTQIVQVRFAELSDSGISEWTVWYELQTDGTLTEKEDVPVNADEFTVQDAEEIWQNKTEEENDEEKNDENDEEKNEAEESAVSNASESDAEKADSTEENMMNQ